LVFSIRWKNTCFKSLLFFDLCKQWNSTNRLKRVIKS
jgi:hypothetical protein